ncbi:MAG: diacylglycerol kinase family protein [Bacilli bacterium]|nr:diacylglycerol kinase family protein [Bacilli bacterium]
MASKGNKYKSKNIIDSFKHAFDGLAYSFKKTKNLLVDVVFAVLVITAGFVFKVSLIEWAVLLLCIALVMSLEMVNTALEEAVNLAMPNLHPIAKISKDVSAGAVLFSAIISVVIGLIIFMPKFIGLF